MKLLFAAGGVVLILLSLSVVAGSAATLDIQGATIQAFQIEADIEILFVQANVDIKPETLQIKSQGTMAAFIELPTGYSLKDIAIDSVRLGYDSNGNGRLDEGEYVMQDGSRDWPTDGGNHDSNGRPALKVTFDRQQVIGLVKDMVYLENITLVVTGRVGNSLFAGSDTIKLVD